MSWHAVPLVVSGNGRGVARARCLGWDQKPRTRGDREKHQAWHQGSRCRCYKQLPAQPCAALLPLLTGLGKTTTTSSSDLLWTWTGRLLCCLLPLPPPPKKSTYPPARERPAAARRESIPVLIVKPTTTPLSSWPLLSTVAVPSGGGAELQCSSSSIACGVVKIGPCMVTRTPVHEDATVPGKPVRFYYER
jgi:hypothetical protein